VLPVNFAFMDDHIVVRTAPGTKLDGALTDSVVAFEVDYTDEVNRAGWRVLVQGIASMITDPAALDRARSRDLRPWAGGRKDHFIQIAIDTISGRRLLPGGIAQDTRQPN
jgi:nitroimidazol reductase NimA-like FMN-containing flavoprotein (pyridoxamine 5'-phosphate oxidase superfamily)